MIACKHGREENVKELVAAEDEDVDDALEDGEQTKSRVTIDVKNKHTKAAIHYAARKGHLVSCKQNIFVECSNLFKGNLHSYYRISLNRIKLC